MTENDTTQAKLDAMYTELHDATIRRILGDVDLEVKEEIHTDVDYKFGTSNTMYDSARVHKNMNPRIEPGYTIDVQIRDKNGYLATAYEAPISESAALAK